MTRHPLSVHVRNVWRLRSPSVPRGRGAHPVRRPNRHTSAVSAAEARLAGPSGNRLRTRYIDMRSFVARPRYRSARVARVETPGWRRGARPCSVRGFGRWLGGARRSGRVCCGASVRRRSAGAKSIRFAQTMRCWSPRVLGSAASRERGVVATSARSGGARSRAAASVRLAVRRSGSPARWSSSRPGLRPRCAAARWKHRVEGVGAPGQGLSRDFASMGSAGTSVFASATSELELAPIWRDPNRSTAWFGLGDKAWIRGAGRVGGNAGTAGLEDVDEMGLTRRRAEEHRRSCPPDARARSRGVRVRVAASAVVFAWTIRRAGSEVRRLTVAGRHLWRHRGQPTVPSEPGHGDAVATPWTRDRGAGGVGGAGSGG
jgi:hypothetical protein